MALELDGKYWCLFSGQRYAVRFEVNCLSHIRRIEGKDKIGSSIFSCDKPFFKYHPPLTYCCVESFSI